MQDKIRIGGRRERRDHRNVNARRMPCFGEVRHLHALNEFYIIKTDFCPSFFMELFMT